MKKLFTALLLILSFGSFAQGSLTTIGGWNAYVHLPKDYATTTKAYPTLIFYPGLNEVGTTATKVIAQGPGAYLRQGWTGNVAVDGKVIEFIVISLQPSAAYPTEYAQNTRLQEIKKKYRVDTTNIFLTGLSHGGWCASTFVSAEAVYSKQIRGVVTVQGMKPDDNKPYPAMWFNYASSGSRYLGFEQIYDGRDTKALCEYINSVKPGAAVWMLTNIGGGGHCCWESYYGGNGKQPLAFTIDGKSQTLYEWIAREVKLPEPPPAPPAPTPVKSIVYTFEGCGSKVIMYVNGTDSTWSQIKLP